MKILNLLAVVACLASARSALAQTIAMPQQVQDISLGMERSELLKRHPKIRGNSKNNSGGRSKSGEVLMEQFRIGDFDSALYIFEAGKLSAISLYVYEGEGASLSGKRKKIYRECKLAWGKPDKKRGTLEPGHGRGKPNTPLAVWKISSGTAMLFATRKANQKDPSVILMLLDPAAKGEPLFEVESTSPGELSKTFSEYGFDD